MSATTLPAAAGNKPVRPLRSDEKAAIILYTLGPERAERFFREMDEEDHRCFAAAFNRLKSVTQDTVNKVVLEFVARISNGGSLRGGAQATRKFLAQFLDEDSVSAIMAEMDGPAGRDVWEKLSNASPQALVNYLKHEQPQTVAVIVSRLRPDAAAKVMMMMPQDRAHEVLLRMTQTASIDREVLNDIRDTLRDDFLNALTKQQSIKRPDDIIGAMFNQMPSDRSLKMMSVLEDKMPEMAERVQKVMFTFNDFATRLDPTSLQAVIKACDTDKLVLALKLAKSEMPHVVEYFFKNMSKRVGEQINEEIEALGAVRLKDAQAAQAEIIALTQDLARKGEITISEGDDEGEQILGGG